MTGTGTENDPYIIYDVDDLQAVSSDLAAYYELNNDIDASVTSGWNGGEGFNPIGVWELGTGYPAVGCSGTSWKLNPFYGNFDGKNYTISDLYINKIGLACPYDLYLGLFGAICGRDNDNVVVKDFTLLNSHVESHSWYTALVVGAVYADAPYAIPLPIITLENIHVVSGYVNSTSSETSLFAGELLSDGTYNKIYIYNCIVEGQIISPDDSNGGFYGWGYHNGVISGCIVSNSIMTGFVNGFAGASYSVYADQDLTFIDCGVSNCTIISNYSVGGFIGRDSYYKHYFYNCYVDNCTISNEPSSDAAGGFTCGIGYESEYHNCRVTNTSVVGGEVYTGLFAGLLGNEKLYNCYAIGTVSLNPGVDWGEGSYVGGFAGYADYVILSDCYSIVTLDGSNSVITAGFCGGFVGRSEDSTITKCYSKGSVTYNGDYVGGFAGAIDGYSISDCYTRCSVNGIDYVGGFVGGGDYSSSTLSECYSTGEVTGSGYVGGFCGEKEPCIISNCFWDKDTSGMSTSDGGTGKTTAEMKTRSTFTDADWDFTSIWMMSVINDGYPAFMSDANVAGLFVRGDTIQVVYDVGGFSVSPDFGTSWCAGVGITEECIDVVFDINDESNSVVIGTEHLYYVDSVNGNYYNFSQGYAHSGIGVVAEADITFPFGLYTSYNEDDNESELLKILNWGEDDPIENISVFSGEATSIAIGCTFPVSGVYCLEVDITGSGYVSIDDEDYIQFPVSGYYRRYTSVDLEAITYSGWRFIDWTGDVANPSADTYISMNDNEQVISNFQAYDVSGKWTDQPICLGYSIFGRGFKVHNLVWWFYEDDIEGKNKFKTWDGTGWITGGEATDTGSAFTLYFDGTYVHLAYMMFPQGWAAIAYKRGLPSVDGTISWDDACTAHPGFGDAVTYGWIQAWITIGVDSSGYPFIGYDWDTSWNDGYYRARCVRSDKNDGTWNTAEDKQLFYSVWGNNACCVVPLENQHVGVVTLYSYTVYLHTYDPIGGWINRGSTYYGNQGIWDFRTISTTATGDTLHWLVIGEVWSTDENEVWHRSWNWSTGYTTNLLLQLETNSSIDLEPAICGADNGDVYAFWAGDTDRGKLFYRQWDDSASQWLSKVEWLDDADVADYDWRIRSFFKMYGNEIGVARVCEEDGGYEVKYSRLV